MEERKELARKGGKASVIARRKKSGLEKTMQSTTKPRRYGQETA